MSAQCPICRGARSEALRYTVLQRHQCTLLKCEDCGFLGAEEAPWLDEAYSDTIVDVDTGVLARARSLEPVLLCLAAGCCPPNSTFADIGAGYGVLVRAMRDRGLDFRWSDPMCENLLARGFELHGEQCAALTAVEVLEHAIDPLAFLGDALDLTGAPMAIVSTELLPAPVPPPEWWYLLPTTGQHISFFEHRTLERMAERLDLQLTSRYNVHVFHRGQVGRIWGTVALTRLNRLASAVVSRRFPSLTEADNGLIVRSER